MTTDELRSIVYGMEEHHVSFPPSPPKESSPRKGQEHRVRRAEEELQALYAAEPAIEELRVQQQQQIQRQLQLVDHISEIRRGSLADLEAEQVLRT
jgi:hypothetical protein